MNVKLNFWIDIATFSGFLVALEPRATGTTIHEWFTVAAVGTLIVHFVLHWDWFMKISAKYFAKLFHSSRLNYLLSILIFLGFITIMVSGLMISQSVMPFLGIEFQRNFAWRQIHNLASNLTLALVAVHVALRWDWVKAAFVKILVNPFRQAKKTDSVLAEEDGI
jgi:cytochrome b